MFPTTQVDIDNLSVPCPDMPTQDIESDDESDDAMSDVSNIPSGSPFHERVMGFLHCKYISHKYREAVEISLIAMGRCFSEECGNV